MSAYLVGEDGPHTGAVITFEEGEEWILGRDPELSYYSLEDPMVSRKHALILMKEGSYFLENLSTTNPLFINSTPIEGRVPLKEDDILQIGNSFFRFTEMDPGILEAPHFQKEEPIDSPSPIHSEPLSKIPFFAETQSRWLLKVISGPNQGAEFGMNLLETHIIGKDPGVADIIFQDLSVSRRHAKIEILRENELLIEDLGSRNGIFVNGSKIEGPHLLEPQDLISLGTTSFLIIDRERAQETIFSIASPPARETQEPADLFHEPLEEEPTAKKFKELFIPTRHLVMASFFGVFLLVGCMSFFALFKTHTVIVSTRDESKELKETLKPFENVQFSYSPSSGKVFLIGHVLTTTDHSELMYLVRTLDFITSIEDNVVVDEGVSESINSLLVKNPNWRGVLVSAVQPGRFVVRGYLASEEEASRLQDYLNLNFSYLSLLENQVVVENTLQTQIQSMLIEDGFVNVTFQFNNGELVLAGRVNGKEEPDFNHLIEHMQSLQGVRQIKNFVIFTNESTLRIDLSPKYQVMGTSKYGETNQYVLINGRILAKGDMLDGMIITTITDSEVQLDKDGLKYKIDYNWQ